MTTAIKRHPYRAAFVAMLIALAVACSASTDVGLTVDVGSTPDKTLESAMQADRDFTAMVKKDGLKAAFLHYMDAADSMFIEPGVVTKTATKIADGFIGSPPDFTIAWFPDGGHGSSAGDMAVTTGRYAVNAGATQVAVGRYITSWRKNAAGEWKAIISATAADPLVIPSTAPDPEGRPG
jgi:ketosteroid isomerase-like protein